MRWAPLFSSTATSAKCGVCAAGSVTLPSYDARISPFGSENVVEVYIGYLRKKIDAPYGLQTLNTVRGMGYRLDPDTSSQNA